MVANRPRTLTRSPLENLIAEAATDADRRQLGIRTIGAVDVTPEERKRLSKLRKRERERERQQAKRHGLRSREQYLADVKSKAKAEAEAAGVSESTLYRRRRAAKNGAGKVVTEGPLEIKLSNTANTPTVTLQPDRSQTAEPPGGEIGVAEFSLCP